MYPAQKRGLLRLLSLSNDSHRKEILTLSGLKEHKEIAKEASVEVYIDDGLISNPIISNEEKKAIAKIKKQEFIEKIDKQIRDIEEGRIEEEAYIDGG